LKASEEIAKAIEESTAIKEGTKLKRKIGLSKGLTGG